MELQALTILIPIFFMFYAVFKNKTITNLQFILNCLWFFILFFVNVNVLDNFPIKEIVMQLTFLFLLVFNVGYAIAAMPLSTNQLDSQFVIKKPKQEINVKFIWVCTLFVLAYYLLLTYRAINFYRANPGITMYDIRYEYFHGNNIIKSNLEYVINNFFIGGIYKFLLIFFVYNIVQYKNTWIGIAIFLIIVLQMFFSGGRWDLVMLVLLLVISMIKYRKELAKKTKTIIGVLIALSLLLVVIVSIQRGVTGIIKQGISYYVSPLVFVGEVMEKYGFEVVGYGRIVFAPIYDFIINALRLFDLTDVNTAAVIVTELTSGFLPVSPTVSFNAMIPIYMFFYLDSGIIGVLLYSTLMGIIFGLVEKKMKRTAGIRTEILWFAFIIVVLRSSQTYYFMSINNLAFFMCVIFMAKKCKSKNVSKEINIK